MSGCDSVCVGVCGVQSPSLVTQSREMRAEEACWRQQCGKSEGSRLLCVESSPPPPNRGKVNISCPSRVWLHDAFTPQAFTHLRPEQHAPCLLCRQCWTLLVGRGQGLRGLLSGQ